MKPKDAMSALDDALEEIRTMLQRAKGKDQVAIAFCVTITQHSGDDVEIACGTGGHGRNIAFAISRILRDALHHIPPERNDEFRDLVNQMEQVGEKSRDSMLPEDFMRCPDTKLH